MSNYVDVDMDTVLISIYNSDKLDICQLISSLKKMSQKRYVVDNIPRAIHDALQE